jgi:predicted nucleic acid-binding protein
MGLLLDANIFLELILDQERSQEVRDLLRKSQIYDFYMSDYALHSIGVLLFRRGLHGFFREFVDDMMFHAGVKVARLSDRDMLRLIEVAQRFRLDFDDAYPYVVAEKYNLSIVSFDGDFDRTDRARVTPDDLLKGKGA